MTTEEWIKDKLVNGRISNNDYIVQMARLVAFRTNLQGGVVGKWRNHEAHTLYLHTFKIRETKLKEFQQESEHVGEGNMIPFQMTSNADVIKMRLAYLDAQLERMFVEHCELATERKQGIEE